MNPPNREPSNPTFVRTVISHRGKAVRVIRAEGDAARSQSRTQRARTVGGGGGGASGRAVKPWPRVIQMDPRMAANAAMCERCENVGRMDDGRAYCQLQRGGPCPNKLNEMIRAGEGCPLGKHEKGAS